MSGHKIVRKESCFDASAWKWLFYCGENFTNRSYMIPLVSILLNRVSSVFLRRRKCCSFSLNVSWPSVCGVIDSCIGLVSFTVWFIIGMIIGY